MTVTKNNFREFLQDKYKNNYREKTHSKENERQVEYLDYGSEDCRIQLNVSDNGVTAKIFFIPGDSGKRGLESYHRMMTIDDVFPEGLSYFQKNGNSNCVTTPVNEHNIQRHPIYFGFLNDSKDAEKIIKYKDINFDKTLEEKISVLSNIIKQYKECYEKEPLKDRPHQKDNKNRISSNEKNDSHPRINNDFDPFEHEVTEEELGIRRFPVSDYCEKVKQLGKMPLEFTVETIDEDGKTQEKTFCFYRDINNGTVRYQLRLKRPTGTQLQQYDVAENDDNIVKLCEVVSWPMASSSLMNYTDEGMPNPGVLPYDYDSNRNANGDYSICGIDKPEFNPQIIYLGMNASETKHVIKADQRPVWRMGYNVMANTVRDSIFSGGFFTDFIKCFPKSQMQKKDWERLKEPAFLGDEENSKIIKQELTWFDVYMAILKKEMDMLRKTFGSETEPLGKFKIIILGKTLYGKLLKKSFFKVLTDDVVFFVFGLHYSKQAMGNMFPDDGEYSIENWLKSRRRIYSVKNFKNMDSDRKKDHRKYEYALLMKDGYLRTFKGKKNYEKPHT